MKTSRIPEKCFSDIDLLFTLINLSYVKAFEMRYGPNPRDWSSFGRTEFEEYAPFRCPPDTELLRTVYGPEKLLPWESKRGDALPSAFLFEREGVYYLIFRGTIAVYEWVYDFWCVPVDYPVEGVRGVKVHKGFADIYAAMRKEVRSIGELTKGKELVIAGHSLGGALSIFAALDCSDSVSRVCTFAAPKPGDEEFARYCNSKIPNICSFKLKGDPVPDLPPDRIPFSDVRFRSPGTDILLDRVQLPGDQDLMSKLGSYHFPSAYKRAVETR